VWKNVLKILAVFVIGTIGGIFADQILWPYFIERPLFYKYRLEQAPIYQSITKEIIIQENTALIEAIEKVEKAVVGIKSKAKTGKTLEGSGLIVTVDEGLIITLTDLVPKGWEVFVFLDNEKIPAKVLQRKNDLALLKIEKTNLSPVGFADFEKIKLGQRVFLLGVIFEKDTPRKLVNEGIIKTFNEEILQTSIFEKTSLWGSSLFDIEGQLVGLNSVDKYGRVSAISIKQIRDFLQF
jgi:S1-C subfamily serine protease